jgi:LPXTG-motif cell wall-anchored protein
MSLRVFPTYDGSVLLRVMEDGMNNNRRRIGVLTALVGGVMALGSLVVGPGSASAGGDKKDDKKVDICHRDQGKPEWKVINISKSALDQHLSHQWGEDIYPVPANGCPTDEGDGCGESGYQSAGKKDDDDCDEESTTTTVKDDDECDDESGYDSSSKKKDDDDCDEESTTTTVNDDDECDEDQELVGDECETTTTTATVPPSSDEPTTTVESSGPTTAKPTTTTAKPTTTTAKPSSPSTSDDDVDGDGATTTAQAASGGPVPPATGGTGGSGTLPQTGSNEQMVLLLGGLTLVSAGALMIALTRRPTEA